MTAMTALIWLLFSLSSAGDWTSHRSHKTGSAARCNRTLPVIVLKDGRSGSTLFGRLLQGDKKGLSKISLEVITKKTAATYTTARKIAIMSEALTPRVPTKGSCPEMIGFTLCPSLHNGTRQTDIVVALREVIQAFPAAKVLVFSRSNLFRTAIASHGTKKKKTICVGGEMETTFPLDNFVCELPHIVAFRSNLYRTAEELGVPFRDVLFEDLISDANATMTAVVDYLDLSPKARTALLASANDKLPRHAPFSRGACVPNQIDRSRLLLRQRGDFVDALTRFSRRVDQQSVDSSCLLAMANAPNDEAFPDVIDFRIPTTGTDGSPLVEPICEKKDPSYDCIKRGRL